MKIDNQNTKATLKKESTAYSFHSLAKIAFLSCTISSAVAQTPADLLNSWNTNTAEDGKSYTQCSQWKITYPTGDEEKKLCEPVASDRQEFYFVNGAGNGIVFRAPIRSDNGTTPNSSYVRSELRERTVDGKSDVYWGTDGHHVIYVKQAITHLPLNKNHLVATQIHGDKSEGIDDSMVLRLEGQHLFLSFNGGKLREDLTISTNYSLGTVHELVFEVINDKHYAYYSEDGKLKNAFANGNAAQYLVKDGNDPVLMDISYGDAYFKAGNYTQSNPEREGSDTNHPNNYGEVVLYDMVVDHTSSFNGTVPEQPSEPNEPTDPSKKYYIDSPRWNLRLAATANGAQPFTTSVNTTGVKMVSSDKTGEWVSFSITEVSSGKVVYLRKRNASDYSVDGMGGGANGQNVHLWGYNSSNENQQWEEIDRGNGYYSYQKKGTNYSLDGGNGGAQAQNVHLWTTSATNYNQHWRKVQVAGDRYMLVKRNALNYALSKIVFR